MLTGRKLNKNCREMLAEGVIEPSQSDWASPIVLVKKKDGSICLFVYYRKLNAQTRTDVYPMPRIEDILDRVVKAKFITILDLTRGYWQVPVADKDRHKMTFTSPFWSIPILCNVVQTKWITHHFPETYE